MQVLVLAAQNAVDYRAARRRHLRLDALPAGRRLDRRRRLWRDLHERARARARASASGRRARAGEREPRRRSASAARDPHGVRHGRRRRAASGLPHRCRRHGRRVWPELAPARRAAARDRRGGRFRRDPCVGRDQSEAGSTACIVVVPPPARLSVRRAERTELQLGAVDVHLLVISVDALAHQVLASRGRRVRAPRPRLRLRPMARVHRSARGARRLRARSRWPDALASTVPVKRSKPWVRPTRTRGTSASTPRPNSAGSST